MSTQKHRTTATQKVPLVPCAIVTVSDTRTAETDTSGQTIRSLLEKDGHRITDYHIVKDEPDEIGPLLDQLAEGRARVILINGGTGISTRDRTYDVVSARLEKTLPGFGELFRMLSYQEIGAAAMLSRAIAGVYRGKVLVSMPGSTHAVTLAMTKLILPELQHLAWELTR
ncbi:MAG: MogA/MoaB family molybdenum cofactor biosynthesis protein [Anaerolineales bacterium]|nr:MogA/MoaB family molybdenum cofactor biosynthesis protein [Anaerolineales bacterium]